MPKIKTHKGTAKVCTKRKNDIKIGRPGSRHNTGSKSQSVNRKNRKSAIKIAKEVGCEVDCHIVWSTFEECVRRDSERKRSVGKDVIKKFLYRWESPYYDEGFDNIKVIYNNDVGFNKNEYTEALIRNMDIPHDNPHHSADILKHCENAFNYLQNKSGEDIHSYSYKALLYAAKYHDIGKPMTKFYKSDDNGRIISDNAHYYNHQNVGAYLSYGLSDIDSNIVFISWLISSHMEPFFNSTYYKNMGGTDKEMIDKLHEADINAH